MSDKGNMFSFMIFSSKLGWGFIKGFMFKGFCELKGDFRFW